MRQLEHILQMDGENGISRRHQYQRAFFLEHHICSACNQIIADAAGNLAQRAMVQGQTTIASPGLEPEAIGAYQSGCRIPLVLR